MVPEHLRENHERTDDHLADLEGILIAIDLGIFNHPYLGTKSDPNSAIHTLNRLARRAMEEVREARRIEWVGLGGTALSDEEMAEFQTFIDIGVDLGVVASPVAATDITEPL